MVPKRVSWSKRRAIQPSATSETTANANAASANPNRRSSMNTRKAGINASRVRVMADGQPTASKGVPSGARTRSTCRSVSPIMGNSPSAVHANTRRAMRGSTHRPSATEPSTVAMKSSSPTNRIERTAPGFAIARSRAKASAWRTYRTHAAGR